jgi:hypothetical protein
MMGSLVTRVLGAVAAAVLSVTMLTSGVASADGMAGMTYDAAAAAISGWKGKPVIGTVSGGLLETGDCIVTSSHKSIFLNPSGRNTRSSEVVLNLNCNNPVASPGHPGNSAMTPQGVKAKKDQASAAQITKNPQICQKSDDLATWCEAVCKRTGLCEV